jgi:enoyl-CoA hydratase
MSKTSNGSGPQPPDGDWLGTPFLTFKREGPFAICTVDRPEARNALTPAMYFGIRYAVGRVNADGDLAGLLITGTGDVFAPGGDLGRGGVDDWMDFTSTLAMDVTPFDMLRTSSKPVVAAVNGLCQGGGLQIALCSDMAVVSDRATFRVPELFRGIADTYYSQMLARIVGPIRTRDLMLTGRVLAAPAARSAVKASLDNYLGLFDRIGMNTSLAGPESVEGFRAFKEKRSPVWVHPDLRIDGRL